MDNTLIGRSAALSGVRKLIHDFAKNNLSPNVLIAGEEGVGKALIARLIHDESHRRRGPFIEVNSSELTLSGGPKPEGGFFTPLKTVLAEAELGTLFLRDVDRLGGRVQEALQQRLETDRIQLKNGSLVQTVRVIASTTRDLEFLVHRGEYNSDLRYLLSSVYIKIPPLRERPEDIRDLFVHYWGIEAGSRRTFHGDLLAFVAGWNWLGNAPELQRFVQRLCRRTDDTHTVTAKDARKLLENENEFEIAFAEEFSPEAVREILTALADYYRACGGVGLQAEFETEEVGSMEMVGG